ncbi:MAG: hypothetical protein ACREX0_08265 [Noviherbaspirillum sp.]
MILSPQNIPPINYGKAMKRKLATDDVIEDLIVATLGADASAREQHIHRESLRGLVRLAKAEQMMEIKLNVERLSGMLDARSARRSAKAVLLAQRLPGILDHIQQQFEFKQ